MCCWFSFIFTVGWKCWVLFYIFLYKSFQKQMIYVNNQDGNIKVVLKIRRLSGWIWNFAVAHAILPVLWCIVITYISIDRLFSVVTSIHCLIWNQSLHSLLYFITGYFITIKLPGLYEFNFFLPFSNIRIR